LSLDSPNPKREVAARKPIRQTFFEAKHLRGSRYQLGKLSDIYQGKNPLPEKQDELVTLSTQR